MAISAAVVLVTLVLAMLTFAHPTGTTAAPTRAALLSAVRACPATPAGSAIRVGSLGKAAGPVTSVKGATATSAGTVRPFQTLDIPAGTDPTGVGVKGAGASGLVVGRYSAEPLSGTRCAEFASDYWFTGLGASSTHYSVIHVDNPTDTPAEVQFTVLWSLGPLDIPALDAYSVPAHSTRTFDLYHQAPHFGQIGIHAAVVQGQAMVSILDTLQTPGQAPASEWLVPQSAPTETVTLLGIPAGNRQILTVANPGQDQVTAMVRLITKTSTFVPADFAGLNVPGGGAMSTNDPSQKSVDLAKILSTSKDVIGIQVESSAPITASLSTFVDNDLVITGGDPVLTTEGGAVLPDGPKNIVLHAEDQGGAVTVISRDATGKVVARNTVQVPTDGAANLGIPGNAVLVQVQTGGVTLRAAVVVTGHGAVVVPVGRVIRISSLPFVRPGVD